MRSSNIDRRDFLATSFGSALLLSAALPSLAKGETPAEIAEDILVDEDKQKHSHQVEETKTFQAKAESAIHTTLEALNPTLVAALLTPAAAILGSNHLIDVNFSNFKAGKLDKEKLIYNNADKIAGVFFEIAVSVLPFALRLPLSQLAEGKVSVLNKKLESDVANITSYHAQSLLYVYLYNPCQSILRKVYIDLLSAKEEYGMDPRKIPLSTISSELKEMLNLTLKGENSEVLRSEDKSRMMEVIRYLCGHTENGQVTIPYAIKRDIQRCFTTRGLIDLLSTALSYPTTMATNFGLGRAVALPARFAIYSRDMLERIEKQGAPQTHLDEEFQTAISYMINSTTALAFEGAIQGFLDMSGFRNYSKDNLAAANLRELLGTLVGWTMFFKIQGVLEPLIRQQVEKEEKAPWIKMTYEYFKPSK